MSNYTKSYNGAAHDANDDLILGADFDVEFDALETASATKANKAVPAATGNVAKLSASGDLQDSEVTLAELQILDGATVTTAELNILDGVTATTAELNILDGATLTTTELNYVDGVTSDLQTQIDALSAADAWALIETWTITATANHIFTFDESAYSDVRIVVENAIPATDGANLQMRLGHTNGGTIISSANYSYEYRDTGDTAFTAVAGTSVGVTGQVGTAANEGVSGTIETVGMTSILGPKGFKSFMVSTNITTASQRRTLEGHCNAAMTTAFDSVQLLWNSGNFEASGTVYMYGLKKA